MITFTDEEYIELQNMYIDLLCEAKGLYDYDPNNFRYTVDEYFKEFEEHKTRILMKGMKGIK